MGTGSRLGHLNERRRKEIGMNQGKTETVVGNENIFANWGGTPVYCITYESPTTSWVSKSQSKSHQHKLGQQLTKIDFPICSPTVKTG
jgi:hypothetical protein